MSKLEQQVLDEQADHDALTGADLVGADEFEADDADTVSGELEDAAGAIADDVAREGLFDGNVYDDPRLKIEHHGRRVTAIELGFLGGVKLNRNDVGDVAFHQGLREGQSVDFLVSATVTGTRFQLRATEKHGTQLIERRMLAIDSVTLEAGDWAETTRVGPVDPIPETPEDPDDQITAEEQAALRQAAGELEAETAAALEPVDPDTSEG